MTGIPSISTTQRSISLANAIAKQRGDLDRAGMELSTLRKADIYQERSSAPSRALEFRARLDVNKSYLTSNQVLAAKLESMEGVIDNVREDAGVFMKYLLASDSAAGNKEDLKRQAEMTLRSIADKLNTTYKGEYLFSGAATGTAPVSIDADLNAVYGGDTGPQLSAEIEQGTPFIYGVRADHPAIAEMLGVLSTIASADFSVPPANDYSSFRDDMIVALGQATENVIGVQTQLGDRQANLDRTIERQEKMARIMNNNIVQIEGVDAEEAALRVNALQVQLQASFEVTARMSQMSFLNYI